MKVRIGIRKLQHSCNVRVKIGVIDSYGKPICLYVEGTMA